MKVSVVTVSYNAVKTIGATLRSVASQGYRDIEYIVVDGASTDGTVEIIEEFSRSYPLRWVSEPDGGLYDAINKGISMATGEVVGLLHSDDLFYDDYVVEKIVRKFGETDAEAVYGDIVFFDGDIENVKRVWKAGEFSRFKIEWGWMPPHPSLYVKRSVLERCGNYRTDLKIAADYEYMLRMFIVYGVTPVYLPETIVRMRLGGLSTGGIKSVLRSNLEAWKSWGHNGIFKSPFFIVSKLIYKLGQLRF